jgi:uncharacterized membrane protein YfcA
MSHGKYILLALMAAFGLVFTAVWAVRRREARGSEGAGTTPLLVGVGFLTNFFDTLGIGSFATTTALFRLWKAVDDRLIPGTLNVGHTIPTVVQASIFITVVEVDTLTLASMIAASVVGAWLGAGLVAGLPRRQVRLGMGTLLLVAASLILARLLGLTPPGGDALALSGGLLAVAVAVNFVLGALMTLGIGLYAPCMILVALLGMNPRAAYPIMMGSCAFLMSAAGIRFVRRGSYSQPASVGLTLGGVPGVLLAAFLVWELPLDVVRWLVVVVVVYTAISMLRAGLAEPPEAAGAEGR